MEELIIHATSLTPFVHFKPDGTCLIEGRSIPTNAIKMYKHMGQWIKDLLDSPPARIKLIIKYEYCDSASLKSIFQILKKIKDAHTREFFEFEVEWYYEKDDNEIFDQGEYLLQHAQVPYKLICISN